MIDYSVIIPVYRGGKTIENLISEICSELSNKYKLEIILVADCPIDNSVDIIHQIQSKNKFVQAIILPTNVGQHMATLIGMKQAIGNFIITMDEDGQHSPSEINKLISHQQLTKADVVYGTYKNREHNIVKTIFAKIAIQLIVWSIPNFYKQFSSFRIIKKEEVKKLLSVHKKQHPFIDGLISLTTKNISHIQVNHHKDITGKSSYSVQKLFLHFINIVRSYSFIKINPT